MQPKSIGSFALVGSIVASGLMISACQPPDVTRCAFMTIDKSQYRPLFLTAPGAEACRTGELDRSTIPSLNSDELRAWEAHYRFCQPYAFRCSTKAAGVVVAQAQIVDSLHLRAFIQSELARRGDVDAAYNTAALFTTNDLFDPLSADYWARTVQRNGTPAQAERATRLLSDLANRKAEGIAVNGTYWVPFWWSEATALKHRNVLLGAYHVRLQRSKGARKA